MKKYKNFPVFLLFLVLTVTLAVSCSQDVSSLVRVGVGLAGDFEPVVAQPAKILSEDYGSSLPSRYYSAIPLWTTGYSGVYGYTAQSPVSGTSLNLLLEQGRWRITVWDVAPDGNVVYEGVWEDYVNPFTGTIAVTMGHKTDAHGFLACNFTSPARTGTATSASVTVTPAGQTAGQTFPTISGVLSSDWTVFSFSTGSDPFSLDPGFYSVQVVVSNFTGETAGQILTVEILKGQTVSITGNIDNRLFVSPVSSLSIPAWTSGPVTLLDTTLMSGDLITASVSGDGSASYQWYIGGVAVLSGSDTTKSLVAPYVEEETVVPVWCLSENGLWFKASITVVPRISTYEFFSDSGYSTSTTVKVGDNASNIYYKKNGVQMGRVGGVIYFIDENAGAGEDKYYVIVASVAQSYINLRWSKDSELFNSPYNGDGLGVGKRVTQWMLENGGINAFPVDSVGTIWKTIRNINNTPGLNGQRDWYVGSPFEYGLAKRIGTGPGPYDVNIYSIFFNSGSGSSQYAWSCYELSNTDAWVESRDIGMSYYKTSNARLIPMRSF